jgi:HAD superfamily hydrolase (TIGR01490 family)
VSDEAARQKGRKAEGDGRRRQEATGRRKEGDDGGSWQQADGSRDGNRQSAVGLRRKATTGVGESGACRQTAVATIVGTRFVLPDLRLPPDLPTPDRPTPAVAFFDLDGTLARGHMIFDFPTHLMDRGLFDKDALDDIRRMREDIRLQRISYRQVAERLPALYAKGVRGQKEKAVSLEAEKFVEWRMDHVFPYAKCLVRLMRESGRPAVAISGSPEDTVGALARRLGMDAAIGTRLETKDGRFTGNVLHNLILQETKKAFFEELVGKLGLDASECFGFGDTEQDVSFLGGVGHPVALNPSTELRTIALSKGWHIFESAQDVAAEVSKLLGN